MNEPREEGRYSTDILTRDRGGYTDHQHYLGAVACWHGYHRHGWTTKTRDGRQLGPGSVAAAKPSPSSSTPPTSTATTSTNTTTQGSGRHLVTDLDTHPVDSAGELDLYAPGTPDADAWADVLSEAAMWIRSRRPAQQPSAGLAPPPSSSAPRG